MTFKAEQQVSYKGSAQPATIISGPHETYGADRWLIRKADGKVTLAREAELEAIADRRTKVAEQLHMSLSAFGKTKPFTTLPVNVRRMYLATADKVLAVLDDDAEAKPAKPALVEGDRIRILKPRYSGADVLTGDVLSVVALRGGMPGWFFTNAPRKSWGEKRWTFPLSAEGIGWERV